MPARRKTAAQKAAEEPKVADEAPHYLDRFGRRHEIDEDTDDTAEEPPLLALPPAS